MSDTFELNRHIYCCCFFDRACAELKDAHPDLIEGSGWLKKDFAEAVVALGKALGWPEPTAAEMREALAILNGAIATDSAEAVHAPEQAGV